MLSQDEHNTKKAVYFVSIFTAGFHLNMLKLIKFFDGITLYCFEVKHTERQFAYFAMAQLIC